MLKSISAKGLKGLEFDQPLGKKTLIIGPNGSGKSARVTAINLLAMGYQPGVGKRPMDTMLKIASGDKMQICGQFDSTHLTRKFVTTKAGAKQEYAVNFKRPKNNDDFTIALSKTPKVIDLSTFLDLSDDKRIQYLIDLHGGESDLGKMDAEITQLRDDLTTSRSDLRQKEQAIIQLENSLNTIQMPSGTLAETKQEIERVTAEYKVTRDNLEKARAEKAKIDAAKEAAVEADINEAIDAPLITGKENKTESRLSSHGFSMGGGKPSFSDGLNEFGDPIKEADGQTTAARIERCNHAADIAKQDTLGAVVNNEAATSIKKIIDAMERGCNSVCAAKLIAKAELKKYL